MRKFNERLDQKCPFCRHPLPESQDDFEKICMKRVEVDDPDAMCHMGKTRFHEGDYDGAFEYFSKAAGLGDVDAHYHLSVIYQNGKGVEKNEKKQLHHLEEAVIGGDPKARHNLGAIEWNNGNGERAAKHWIIAAKLGYVNALGNLKILYADGIVSKEDFAAALRSHQAAIDATKSPQRAEALGWMEGDVDI